MEIAHYSLKRRCKQPIINQTCYQCRHASQHCQGTPPDSPRNTLYTLHTRPAGYMASLLNLYLRHTTKRIYFGQYF